MKFLVCRDCGSFIGLTENESTINHKCQCGGQLIAVETNNGATPNFSYFNEDYNEILNLLENNKLRFNTKESELSISLGKDEKYILDFKNIDLINFNSFESIDTGFFTITNKKIVFSGNKNILKFPLNSIKDLSTFDNLIEIKKGDDLEVKSNYFTGFDQLKITLPIKRNRDEYSLLFNAEMIKTMINSAINNYEIEEPETLEDSYDYSQNKEQKIDPEKNKLMNCPDCDKKISKRAKTCPNCGLEIKKVRNVSSGIALLLGLFFGPLGYIYLSRWKELIIGLIAAMVLFSYFYYLATFVLAIFFAGHQYNIANEMKQEYKDRYG